MGPTPIITSSTVGAPIHRTLSPNPESTASSEGHTYSCSRGSSKPMCGRGGWLSLKSAETGLKYACEYLSKHVSFQ